MSLATTGGGAGLGGGAGGGLILAHPAGAMGRVAAPPPPAATFAAGSGGPTSTPSAAVLGADLLDKNQVTLRQVKNVSHLPIVAIDLHGSVPEVAYFPKKPEDPSKGMPPVAVGKISTDVALRPGEVSHKTLRKFLAKSRGFTALTDDVLASSTNNSNNSKDGSIVISKPQCWLGLRRVADAPQFLRNNYTLNEDSASSPAIAEDVGNTIGLTVTNSTLDGSPSNQDDYDRVVFKLRLCESKKAITILPEEATEIIIHAARYLVASRFGKNNEQHSDEDICDYPTAVALPAYAFGDAAIDALSDALGNSSIIVQRNVAALAGALLPAMDGKLSKILQRLNTVQEALHKQHQMNVMKDPTAIPQDDIMVLVVGMTPEGVETTAIQISAANFENVSCLFGNFRVIANVSYQHVDPVSRLQQCATELEAAMHVIAPEADEPSAVIFCGSAADQRALATKWEAVKNAKWKNIPVFASTVDAIAKGCSVLAAVSHGRLSRITKPVGAAKSRAELGIRVQNVAPIAVAVRMNYFAGQDDKWSEMKTVFDFDRQIPAGPYPLDFKASEIAVHRSASSSLSGKLSEEDFMKEVKQFEGAKGIPMREEAALNFQIQVMQKWTRDGEWKPVGDIMEPLVKETEKDGKIKRDACEEVRLELALGVTGMLTSSLIGERTSVVVASKAARNSAIRYWFCIIFAVAFVGYFLFKSYWDDFVLKRDTKRLLAFYKHVMPGSIHDGDEHGAMYTCYKYRHTKEKLWRNLEKKYGEPVLYVHDYEAMLVEMAQQEKSPKPPLSEEETVNLDDDTTDKKEAPDL